MSQPKNSDGITNGNVVSNSTEVVSNSNGVAAWWFLCDFSAEEMFILRSSFGAVKNRLENVATVAFTNLFDERPDAFAIFVGKRVLPENRHEVAYSWETKQHGLRVLSIVERCLNRIDKWELFQDVVSGLAVRHLRYGAKPVYILSLFGCLRDALLKEMNFPDEEGKRAKEESASCELGVTAINSAWNKFFRTLGLALVAEMLAMQEQVTSRDSTQIDLSASLNGISLNNGTNLALSPNLSNKSPRSPAGSIGSASKLSKKGDLAVRPQ